METRLEHKLANLPKQPGVYQHKDKEGRVLYVGKAKNLRNRVRSYFQTNRSQDGRIRIMVSKVADVEVIVTDTEVEALILENNLIKQLKPRYNINLRDDKTYPYICIKNERFPRIFPTRRVIRDGSQYFGPYSDVRSMKYMLETIRGIFKLRSCNLNLSDRNIEAGKFEACLDYHIQKCAAPCIGLESEDHYNETIEQIVHLLEGKTRDLLRELKTRMQHFASNLQFEAAAELRDRIDGLERFSSSQKVVTDQPVDRDLFALSRDDESGVACGVLFKVREGKIIGRQHKFMTGSGEYVSGDLLQAFVENHYADTSFFPDEVFLSLPLTDPSAISEFLRERKGRKVILHTPQRGQKHDLMQMVDANARLLLGEYLMQKAKQEEDRIPKAVLALKDELRLRDLPMRIECFDISHLGGTGTVASCVVFVRGKARKSEYRTFKIRSVENKPDDFQSMREVVSRRYRRATEEGRPLPDLIIIDGGKGQLSSAVEAMREIDFYGKAPVIGLAKRLEEVFFPGDSDSVLIPKKSPSLRLLQQIRDEAHRFAITFQRKQRKNTLLHSELMDIPGVGAKTVQKLLSMFGSVNSVRELTPDELQPVVGQAMAKKISSHFHPPDSPESS